MDDFFIPFLILLVFTFIARFVNEKANKKLSPEKKIELMDLFSNQRLLNFAIIIGLVALYFFALKFQWLSEELTHMLYLLSFVAYMAYNWYSVSKKLKNDQFPSDYIKQFLISTFISFAGLIVFFILIFKESPFIL